MTTQTKKDAIQRALVISARINYDAGYEIDFIQHEEIKTDLVELRELAATWHKKMERKLLEALREEQEIDAQDVSDFESSAEMFDEMTGSKR